MYRDIDKRRNTTRERVRRYRALHKGVTDEVGVTIPVIPKEVLNRPPTVAHHPACRCLRCSTS